MEKEMTFATELLQELKASSKRWFIAFIITLILWFTTITGFVVYLSLPVEETTTETVTSISQDSEDNGVNTYVGGDYNGKTDNKN